MLKDKFNLTKEENIFLAKKRIVENIYHSAKLEGCNVTFPDTQTILGGVSVAGVKINDVECILNLRNAWKFLLSNIDAEFNLDFACKINYYVAMQESLEWGKLRTGEIGITGVDFKPKIPVKNEVVEEMNNILKINCITERALIYFLWSARSQLFWDGNKRTSTLCANKILIPHGKGIFSIRDNDLEEFNRRLTEFYNSNNYNVILDFLYNNCVLGIVYN
ncbi:MAG: Fic family protein [Dehalobacterium sp.]|jgi:Fic family protein